MNNHHKKSNPFGERQVSIDEILDALWPVLEQRGLLYEQQPFAVTQNRKKVYVNSEGDLIFEVAT